MAATKNEMKAVNALIDLLAEHREGTGLSRGDVAGKLKTGQSNVYKLEKHMRGDVKLSTLLRYAGAIGMQLVIDIQPAPKAKRRRSAK